MALALARPPVRRQRRGSQPPNCKLVMSFSLYQSQTNQWHVAGTTPETLPPQEPTINDEQIYHGDLENNKNRKILDPRSSGLKTDYDSVIWWLWWE